MKLSTIEQLTERVSVLELAIIDLLEGSAEWYEIQAATGCTDERCHELSTLYAEISNRITTGHVRLPEPSEDDDEDELDLNFANSALA